MSKQITPEVADQIHLIDSKIKYLEDQRRYNAQQVSNLQDRLRNICDKHEISTIEASAISWMAVRAWNDDVPFTQSYLDQEREAWRIASE